ncbi:MAG: phosphatase PAP2 family protein [Burkholderiales bacterium]|jgi:membrane-associated phospholipid phosphatase|nr:phosphatase PAP2 family protein [Burkholderiales bacterium]
MLLGLEQPLALWRVVTHLGSSSLMLPLLVVVLAGIWRAGHTVAARTWLGGVLVAAGLTLVSKILFMGWGIGSATLNFTGVSGHAVLAASVFPVLLHWLLAPQPAPRRYLGLVLGLLLAGVVAVSRVVLGAHSASEVIIAWAMGLLVSLLAVRAMPAPGSPPRWVRLAPLLLLFSFHTGAATYLPSHAWEVRLSLALSGHAQPFTRQHLLLR